MTCGAVACGAVVQLNATSECEAEHSCTTSCHHFVTTHAVRTQGVYDKLSPLCHHARGVQEVYDKLSPFCLHAHAVRTQGVYDKADGFQSLDTLMSQIEAGSGKARANRMFFLSIPPNVFTQATSNASGHCSSK